MASWQLKFCKAIKSTIFFLSRFPVFDFEQVKLFVDERTSLADIRQYLKSSTFVARKRTMVMIVAYLLYSFKTALNPIVTFLMLNTYDIFGDTKLAEGTISRTRGANVSSTLQFVCLSTNCSSLSQGQSLFRDMSKLHVLNLCYPTLAKLYSTPIMKLDFFGSFVASLSAYGTLALGAWPNIEQLVFRSSNRTIMFVCAPELTRNQLRIKARAYLEDMFASLNHFEFIQSTYNVASCEHSLSSASLSSASTTTTTSTARRASTTNTTCLTKRKTSNSLVDYHNQGDEEDDDDNTTMWLINYYKQQLKEPRVGHLRHSSPVNLEHKWRASIKGMVDDCLPIVRSPAWHSQMVRMFCNSAIVGVTAISLTILVAFIYIERKILWKRQLYLDYAHSMSSANCSMWLTHAPNEPLELEKVRLSWTLFSFTEMAIMNMSPVMSITLLLAYFHVAYVCEIRLWLRELGAHLLSSKLVLAGSHRWAPLDDEQKEASSQVQLLQWTRDSIINATFFTCFFPIPWKRETTSHKLRSLNPEAHDVIRDLEIVYVHFRMFLDHSASCRPAAILIITLTYLLNYGCLIICVLFARQSRREFLMEPSFIIAFSFIVANSVLFLAANFHAQTDKLQPMVWSLIANTTGAQNVRLQHLRTLWLRQIEYIQSVGGISIKAFGLRVTYVNNIQILIWTATILVLTMPTGPN